MSCNKAQKYFEQNSIELEEVSDAKKEKINPDQAWEILSECRIVHIAKGKSVLSFQPDASNKEDILKASIGRSGTLRAPVVRKKDRIWIGFNESIYTNVE